MAHATLYQQEMLEMAQLLVPIVPDRWARKSDQLLDFKPSLCSMNMIRDPVSRLRVQYWLLFSNPGDRARYIAVLARARYLLPQPFAFLKAAIYQRA